MSPREPLSGHLTQKCLDAWLGDFDEFRHDFLRQCQIVARACGYTFTFNQDRLKIAHDNWKGQCKLWEDKYLMADSRGLSPVKILALLLYQLSCVDWVTSLHEYDGSLDGLEFDGTPDQRNDVRRDINAGRGTYLAFQFVIQTINWFESARVDCLQPFMFRLTGALEHDTMVYLLSERREEMAIYLMLHALYARDPKVNAH
jgi:hypothetical protein